MAARRISADGLQLGTVALDLQPPYLSGGQRAGFRLPAHRSFLGTSKFMIDAKKKQKKEPYIPGLKTPRLYG
jgi:hypothetical protein